MREQEFTALQCPNRRLRNSPETTRAGMRPTAHQLNAEEVRGSWHVMVSDNIKLKRWQVPKLTRQRRDSI